MGKIDFNKDLEAILPKLQGPWNNKVAEFSNPNYLKTLCDKKKQALEDKYSPN
ncbi:MAG: hypothetical protein JW791_03330 [Nanoarchaeota archaeon]|nr:hypothetical protein [Nanoarchaeota archaeon]